MIALWGAIPDQPWAQVQVPASSVTGPLSVRLQGKVFPTPAGDPDRHRDLLQLGFNPDHIVYLQVDQFRAPNTTRNTLQLLKEMRRYKPYLRVVNGEALLSIIDAENYRGQEIQISGFLYQRAGLLMISEAHLITE